MKGLKPLSIKVAAGVTVGALCSALLWVPQILDLDAWPHHVSDLAGWDSQAAGLYGVHSIPASFLIDPNGIIVGKNLRGPALDSELDKYVKSF